MPSSFRLYISDGMAIYIGRQVQTKLHTHHAVEIVMAFHKPFLLSKDGREFEKSEFSVVAADLPHQFTGQDDYYIFVYFDAELSYALQLDTKLQLKEHGIVHYSGEEIIATRNKFVDGFWSGKLNEVNATAAIQQLLQSITGTTPAGRAIESRIANAAKFIQSSLHNEIRAETVAASIFLSESRFAHLFKEQTGIPFRRYVLWCRMQAALKSIMTGQSFTQAAYEGGFADMAHLSRIFTEMFGVSPSEVLKQ